jgi:hypothetical protein
MNPENGAEALGPVEPGAGLYTGSIAHQIWAEFNRDLVNVVAFTHYRTPEAIPTTLQLPCQGTGTVTFTTRFGTMPCSVDARDDVVAVSFINIAV